MSTTINTSKLKKNSLLKKAAIKQSDLKGTNSGQQGPTTSKKLKQKTPEPFQCVICSQEFIKHCDLIAHFRQHGSEIDIRGRPILESTLLKYPATRVAPTKIDLVDCEWCPEAFPTISKAIEHKFRKHRFEMNYFCKTCGKLFPLKIGLRQHERIEHDKIDDSDDILSPSTDKTVIETATEKSEAFMCRHCGTSFENIQALKFHEKCIHRIEKQLLTPTICPPPSKKIKMNNANEVISVYYCHLCGTEYVLKFNLRKHLELHHTDEERNAIPEEGIIICKACESIFYSKKAYEIHNINHRPDDLYVTCEEQRQKIVARVDQDFDIRRVPKSIEKFIPGKLPTKSYSRCKPTITTASKLIPINSEVLPSTSQFNSNNSKNEDETLSPVESSTSSSEDDETEIIRKKTNFKNSN